MPQCHESLKIHRRKLPNFFVIRPIRCTNDDPIRIETCSQSHKINKVDVFDIHLICYDITINTLGCLLSDMF